MTLTVYYQGAAKSENVAVIIEYVEKYALAHNWHINQKDSISIMVTPHSKSESMEVSFDEKHKFAGFVKTGLAPDEIHEQVIRLFCEVRPMLKKLTIHDESGCWNAYIAQGNSKNKNEIIHFPTRSEEQLVTSELSLPPDASDIDYRFWKTSPEYLTPFLHIPAVRDRMGFDLLIGQYLPVAHEIKEELEKEGFYVLSIENWIGDDIGYFIYVATWWAWKQSSGMKATEMRRNKCIAFAWALARGCHGFGGGFLGQTHRRAHMAIDKLEADENEAGPVRSLEIFYALFDFCGLKRPE